jgi:hypothetical protein
VAKRSRPALPREIPPGDYRIYLGSLVRQLNLALDETVQAIDEIEGRQLGYGHLKLNANQAIGGAAPIALLFTNVNVDGAFVSYNSGTGKLTLAPGAIYRVLLHPTFEFTAATGNAVARFWDLDAAALVGTQANKYALTFATNVDVAPVASCFVAISPGQAAVNLEMRLTAVAAVANVLALETWASVTCLGSLRTIGTRVIA